MKGEHVHERRPAYAVDIGDPSQSAGHVEWTRLEVHLRVIPEDPTTRNRHDVTYVQSNCCECKYRISSNRTGEVQQPGSAIQGKTDQQETETRCFVRHQTAHRTERKVIAQTAFNGVCDLLFTTPNSPRSGRPWSREIAYRVRAHAWSAVWTTANAVRHTKTQSARHPAMHSKKWARGAVVHRSCRSRQTYLLYPVAYTLFERS